MIQKTLSQKSPSEQSDNDYQNANRIAAAIKKAKHIERLATNPKALITEEGLTTALKLLKHSEHSFGYSQLPAPVIFDAMKKIENYKFSPSEALYHHLKDISEVNKAKVNALLVCDETELPWQDFFVFEKVGEAFNNRLPKFAALNPLSPGECCWTVEVMNRVALRNWRPEIEEYMAAILWEHGFLIPPKVLDFVSLALENHTKVTDTKHLRDMYEHKIIHDNNPILDVQLKRLAACDYYIRSQAVFE